MRCSWGDGSYPRRCAQRDGVPWRRTAGPGRETPSARLLSMIPAMAGRVALHGGGEFLPGDELCLRAILDAAAVPAGARGGSDEAVRVVVVPTAAARHNPDAASGFGSRAFERVGKSLGRPVVVETARVVDGASADDPS